MNHIHRIGSVTHLCLNLSKAFSRVDFVHDLSTNRTFCAFLCEISPIARSNVHSSAYTWTARCGDYDSPERCFRARHWPSLAWS